MVAANHCDNLGIASTCRRHQCVLFFLRPGLQILVFSPADNHTGRVTLPACFDKRAENCRLESTHEVFFSRDMSYHKILNVHFEAIWLLKRSWLPPNETRLHQESNKSDYNSRSDAVDYSLEPNSATQRAKPGLGGGAPPHGSSSDLALEVLKSEKLFFEEFDQICFGCILKIPILVFFGHPQCGAAPNGSLADLAYHLRPISSPCCPLLPGSVMFLHPPTLSPSYYR